MEAVRRQFWSDASRWRHPGGRPGFDFDSYLAALNEAFKTASESDALQGILGYSEEPLVSSDLRQDPRSAIVDGLSTMTIGDNMVKVIAWYDNEWGYSCRVADLIALVCEAGIPGTA